MSKGVLLVNLGSPDSTDPKDVKKYLDEFLMDERVIDVPLWARNILVRGIILNTRPKKSAEAYQKIWWDEGSPLIVLSERLRDKIDKSTSVPIALAMRYGKPNIKSGLQELKDQGVDEVLIFPLYPQFAMATTETILVLGRKARKGTFS
jgi:protoporphyrin/coproporphyrin ferrochelatase